MSTASDTIYATGASGTTSTGVNWANTTNATGSSNGVFADWSNVSSGAVGTLELTGYNGQTAMGGVEPQSVDAVSARIWNYVSSTSRITAATAQLFSGAVAIGSPVTVTRTTTTTNNQLITFPTAPTWAQCADLRVRIVYTRGSVTTAGNAFVDAAALSIDYTPIFDPSLIALTPGTPAQSTTTETTITPALPAGLVDGDWVLVVGTSNASGGGFTGISSGWEVVLANTDSVNGATSLHGAAWARKWVSGDTAPVLTFTSGRAAAVCIRVQNADPTTFLDVAASVTQAPGSTQESVDAPTLTPVTTGAALVALMFARSSLTNTFRTFTTPPGMTTAGYCHGNDTTTTNSNEAIFYDSSESAGVATGIRTSALSGTATGAFGASFLIKPAQSGVLSGAVSLLQTPTFTADATRVQPGAVSLSASPSLTTASDQTFFSSVSLTSSASLSAVAVVSKIAVVSLSATSTISTIALRIAVSSVSLVVSPALTTDASSFSILDGAVVITAESTILASATSVVFASLSLNASPTLSALSNWAAYSSASLTAVPSLNVGAPTLIVLGSVSLVGGATLTVNGLVIGFPSLTMTSTSTFNVEVAGGVLGAVSLLALIDLITAANRTTLSSLSWTAIPTFSALALQISLGMVACTVDPEINIGNPTNIVNGLLGFVVDVFTSFNATNGFRGNIELVVTYNLVAFSFYHNIPGPISITSIDISKGISIESKISQSVNLIRQRESGFTLTPPR